MLKVHEARITNFKRINEEQIARREKFKAMNEKVQKIQFEMQQKMKAAYDEFNSI